MNLMFRIRYMEISYNIKQNRKEVKIMKKIYENPKMEVVEFETEDVLTISDTGVSNDNQVDMD